MAIQDVVEGEVIEAGDQYDPDLNSAFYAFIDSVDTEANAGGQIAVFEVPVDHKGMARARATRTKLFTVPIGACTYEEICERVLDDFMKSGDTMIIQLMGTRDGQRGVKFNKQIRLRKSNNADKTTNAPQSETMMLLRAMNESAARDRAEMRALLQDMLVNRGPQVDPMQFGMQMATKLTELAATLNRPASAPSIIPGVAGGTPTSQMMEMMTVMGMMQKFFGGKHGDPPPDKNDLAEIIKTVGEMAKPLLGAYQANALANAAKERRATLALEHHKTASDEPPDRAVRNPGPNVSHASAEPETLEMKLLAQLKDAMPALVDFATQKAPVGEVAKLALQTMPDDQALNDTLYTLLKDDECLNKLATLDPRVNENREWFESFRVALIAEFEPDEVS